jgi:GcrA cell cycle regulator
MVGPRNTGTGGLMNNFKAAEWSQERIKMLTDLCAEGLSSGEIASRLGVTRNSVIGQSSRRGLTLSFTRGSKPKAPPAEPRQSRTIAPSEPRTIAHVIAPTAHINHATITAVSVNDYLATSRPCTLMQLSATRCRWPYGDPKKPGFHYCGGAKEPERSYCPTHIKLAHREPLPYLQHGPTTRTPPHMPGTSRILESEDA